MHFKITIARLGFAVITIPVVVLLGLIGWLYAVELEQEKYTQVMNRALQINGLINERSGKMLDVVRCFKGFKLFEPNYDPTDVQNALKSLGDTDRQLAEMVKDDPVKTKKLRISVAEINSGVEKYIGAQETYKSGVMGPKSQPRKNFFKDMQQMLQVVSSRDVFDFGREATQLLAQYPERQAAHNAKVRAIQIMGAFTGLGLSLILGLMLNRFVLRRIKTVNDNSYLLACTQPLNPPLKGSDEIALLDHAFHEMAEALDQAAKKERAIVENARDVLTTLDNKGIFVAVNPASETVLGYSPNELVGSRLLNLVHADDVDSTNAKLRQTMAGSLTEPFETRLQRKDGRIIDVEWSAVWDAGERTMFCVVHDITERKQAERLRNEVMAMVSHDLKTPLATIRSFLEMLETGMFGRLNDRGEKLLVLADRSTGRMLTLIKDLLEMEKLEAGMLELEKGNVNVTTLFEQSAHAVASQASEADVQIKYEPENISIYADSDRMVQILINLLSNAIKFSPRGSVVQLAAEQHGANAIIKVIDHGRGIPDQLKQSIFDRFKQVQIADAKDKGGSGLGLAICKALIELHGGEVTVESEVGVGSTFVLQLPNETGDSVSARSQLMSSVSTLGSSDML